MSYSSRHRYKTMREKNESAWKKLKIFITFASIAIVLLAIKNRVYIQDYLYSYFN